MTNTIVLLKNMFWIVICLGFFTMHDECTALHHSCYVCGPDSELSFSSLPNVITPKTCDNFDSMGIEERKIFKMECPEGNIGCITKVGVETIMRSCTDVSVNDCQSVNGIYVCICNRSLCNEINATSIRDELKQELNIEMDLGEENDDDGGGDDDDENIDESSGHKPDSSINIFADDTIESINKVANEVSTMQPSINRAVNFNLGRIFFIIHALHFSFKFLVSIINV